MEERMEHLETTCARIEEILNYLVQMIDMEYVTPKELAEMMNCSVNHIYQLIQRGEIICADHLGTLKRIPMSQFRKVSQHNISYCLPFESEDKKN